MPYEATRTPVRLSLNDLTTAQELEKGVNCQSLVNAAARALGIPVPDGVRSSEWAQADLHDIPVADTIEIQPGTVLGLTRIGENDPKKIHLVIARSEDEIIHASRSEGRVVVCTLEELLTKPEYANLVFAKHPTRRDAKLYNPDILRLLGFALDK